jgi:hypothetical protein
MWGWLRKKPAPLTGAPQVRRQKTYSAQSGYVYQYYYEGQREAARGRERGAEYVFAVTADRKSSFPVSVFVSADAVAAWEQRHGRSLTATERYALAKMALFGAFDQRENPGRMREEVRLQPADVEAILERLGIE